MRRMDCSIRISFTQGQNGNCINDVGVTSNLHDGRNNTLKHVE